MNVVRPTPVHAAACGTTSEHWCGRETCPVACSDPDCSICHPEIPEAAFVFRGAAASPPGVPVSAAPGSFAGPGVYARPGASDASASARPVVSAIPGSG